MGYILPITQHTYQNYHYRMLESKSSPHNIGKLYKAVFQTVQREKEEFHNHSVQEEQLETFTKEKVTPFSQRQLRDHYYVEQQEKAEMTGKGGVMNRQV